MDMLKPASLEIKQGKFLFFILKHFLVKKLHLSITRTMKKVPMQWIHVKVTASMEQPKGSMSVFQISIVGNNNSRTEIIQREGMKWMEKEANNIMVSLTQNMQIISEMEATTVVVAIIVQQEMMFPKTWGLIWMETTFRDNRLDILDHNHNQVAFSKTLKPFRTYLILMMKPLHLNIIKWNKNTSKDIKLNSLNKKQLWINWSTWIYKTLMLILFRLFLTNLRIRLILQ